MGCIEWLWEAIRGSIDWFGMVSESKDVKRYTCGTPPSYLIRYTLAWLDRAKMGFPSAPLLNT